MINTHPSYYFPSEAQRNHYLLRRHRGGVKQRRIAVGGERGQFNYPSVRAHFLFETAHKLLRKNTRPNHLDCFKYFWVSITYHHRSQRPSSCDIVLRLSCIFKLEFKMSTSDFQGLSMMRMLISLESCIVCRRRLLNIFFRSVSDLFIFKSSTLLPRRHQPTHGQERLPEDIITTGDILMFKLELRSSRGVSKD